jgi:hypothetical protein
MKWDDLRTAVLESTTGSSLDEMVCLRHTARQREPVSTPDFVRSDVVYWKMDDIATCLAFGPNQSTTRSAAAESLARLGNACSARSEKIKWTSMRHRRYFLGPLAYLLLYLEGAYDYVYSALEEQPLEYGNDAQSTDLRSVFICRISWSYIMVLTTTFPNFLHTSVVFDKVIQLKESLNPSSELHRRQDWIELEGRVLEFRNLIEELPLTIQLEYGDDLSFAIQLFLTNSTCEKATEQGQE